VIHQTAAVVTTGSRWQRWAGVLLAMPSFLAGWFLPSEHGILRCLCVLLAFSGVMRVVDLRRGTWSLRDRVIHLCSLVDTRKLTPAPPSFDVAAAGGVVAWEALAVATYYGFVAVGRPVHATDWLARWLFGLAFVYTLSAGAYPLLYLGYRAAGFITPPLHIAPAGARSVQEFWGERWNRTVGAWLSETFFLPLARKRRPALGALAAFTASALLHAYLALVGVGWVMALWMLGFFLAQAVVILFERLLRVRAWGPWAGHVWTVAWMTGLSPMFTEPMVRAFGY
jgi:Membrane bound O-acyl transferase family